MLRLLSHVTACEEMRPLVNTYVGFDPGSIFYCNCSRVEPEDPEKTFEKVFLSKTGVSFSEASMSPAATRRQTGNLQLQHGV